MEMPEKSDDQMNVAGGSAQDLHGVLMFLYCGLKPISLK